ncbi:MAG: hypothetical protein M1832_005400 [Thelocarpon impressellum]|nr:MAG: hypothetical protein M1832_005400 [Thelocarpon impressellum]
MDGHLVLFWRVSWLGIQIVRQLDTMDSVEKYDERVHVFLSLAIYTDKRDVWTTEASFAGASSLLEEHSDAARKPEVLVEHILRGVIRPRFAKSKNPAITAQGRKAIAPPRRVYEAIHEEADAKPWKFKEVYLLTVLRWTLQNLDTESVSLLSGAYPALLKLARTRHPENGQERSRLLDQVFRQGILRGHAHCTGNIGISTLLLRQTEAIIHEMGLSSVKHLKDILPMVNEHLTSPFITASHSLLLACVATLQTLIVTVWPRIPFHRTTILLGLCSAWCRLAPDVGALTGGTTAANEALRHTFKLLRAVCSKEVARAEVDFDAEFERLVAADQTLAGVFE